MHLNIKLLILSKDLSDKQPKVFKNKKAFTILEITLVVAVIWILMVWMTIYLWWSDEKRAIIEAQWCASTIWGEMTNYVFFALTSKNLRLEDSNSVVSPDTYTIWLSNCSEFDGDTLCNSLNFWYQIWWGSIEPYKEVTVKNTCRQNQSNLKFFRNWWDNTVYMNKWFTTTKLNDSRTFQLEWWNLLWDIIIVFCSNDACSPKKEISKRVVDWRSQTISQHNCAFYEDDWFKCKKREN